MEQVCLWWTSWDVSLGLALLARDAPPVSLRASRNWKPPQVERDAFSARCLHFADQSRGACPTSSPLSQCFEEHFNCIEFNFHSFSKFYQIYTQSLTIRENVRVHISLEGSRRRECPSVLHCLSLGVIETENMKFPCVSESWLLGTGWSCWPPPWTQPAVVGRKLVIRSPYSRSLAVGGGGGTSGCVWKDRNLGFQS